MEALTLEEVEALPREYLTTREVAAVMGLSCNTLYKKFPDMPFAVLRVGRNYRIPKKPFVAYMRNGQRSEEG